MGNKATGGPFAPLVVVVRNVVGEKDFNKLRGKAISLHSQGEYWSNLAAPFLKLLSWRRILCTTASSSFGPGRGVAHWHEDISSASLSALSCLVKLRFSLSMDEHDVVFCLSKHFASIAQP
jgi:hypothetical protein